MGNTRVKYATRSCSYSDSITAEHKCKQGGQLFKGLSSKVIRAELPEIKKYLWGNDFWADGLLSETVGHCSEKIILDYVRNQ